MERNGRALTRRGLVAGSGLAAMVLAGREHRAAGQAANATPAAETRTIAHALGTTEVPVEPRRVVAFESAIDVALLVGAAPVGIDAWSATKRYLADQIEGIPLVGNSWEPNLERIAELDPDLILGLDISIGEFYDDLSAIAPTVGIDFVGADGVSSSGEWKRYNRGYAEVLGRTEKFDRALADYLAKAGRFRAAMGDRLGTTDVAILRASPDYLRFDLPGIFMGNVVYTDAGLGLPPALAAFVAANPNESTLDISTEMFDLADGADALFVWQVSGDPEADRAAIAAMLDDPLLGRLDAVAAGRAYAMGDHWFSESVLGATLILDDLERYLLADGGATPEAGG